MRKQKKSRAIAMGLSLAVLMTTGCGVELGNVSDETMDETLASAEAEENTSSEIRAQDDYYGYCNFDRLKELEISYGHGSAGSFEDVIELVDEEMDTIIDGIVQGKQTYEAGSNEQMVYDVYWQNVNGLKVPLYATELLQEPVTWIQQADSIEALLQATGQIRKEYGCDLLYQVSVETDIHDRTKNALVLYPISAAVGTELEDLIEERHSGNGLKVMCQEILTDFGVSQEEADLRADEVIYLMLDVAADSDFSLYHADNPYAYAKRMSNKELDGMLTQISIEKMEDSLCIENPYDGWYLYDADQLIAMDALLTEEHLEGWKDYCICQLVNEYQGFFSDEHMKKWNFTLNREPDKVGKDAVKQYLPDQMGELYARAYYDEELQQSVDVFCRQIIESYGQLIENCDWLSAAGKKDLMTKLNKIVFFIGAPDEHEIDPKDAALIGENGFITAKNLAQAAMEEQMKMIGNPSEEMEFHMSAQTVNACYYYDNTVTIPFAIMHAPFYDKDADFYRNLGGLGMVLSHEISHAFDSNCIAFDENGNYRPDWISQADRDAFEVNMQKVREYYDAYTIMDVYHVDGDLTLGENFADLGAMECLMKMATNEKEQKAVFENYANIWCNLAITNDAIQSLSLDVHSPAQVRVNAVLSSCDAFYQVYDVKEGDGMYLPPEERVSRW